MKNYFKYVFCLFVAFSFIACEQESSSADSQATDNQESTEQKSTEHKPQPAPKTLTDEVDEVEGTVDVIEQIRANYGATMKKIDNESLKKLTKEFDCEDDPIAGTLTRYYDGDKIEVIEHSIGGGHGWKIQKIYFKDGEPYFVFVEDGSWYFGGPEGTSEAGENTVDDITETRYYLENGKVIRKLNKKYLLESWKPKPDISKIPNKTMTDGVGKAYPDAAEIPNWIKGKLAVN